MREVEDEEISEILFLGCVEKPTAVAAQA